MPRPSVPRLAPIRRRKYDADCVQPAVAMKISGHSTLHIFQRYNIINESDLNEAAKKVEERKS